MSMEKRSVADLMKESGVGFGTSGARGAVESMSDRVCYIYTRAFLQHLEQADDLVSGCDVAIAGDYRSSTPRIMRACQQAVTDAGFTPVNCGFIPTPAVTLFGMSRNIPSIMVTGSHIPDDRNGIKFNKAAGEILKQDEAGIRAQWVEFDKAYFENDGSAIRQTELSDIDPSAYNEFISRYLDFFPDACLGGLKVGLYEHSAVSREALGEILRKLGAEVIPLARSDIFIPVDTEAIRPEDVVLAKQWASERALDVVVSSDGDGDRPLVSDEQGNWLRGDVAGVLCARYLRADNVVTPVSSNSAVEKSDWFEQVIRTRIGSPYVIAAMNQLLDSGATGVVGYEANGGFLIADALMRGSKTLAPLPTRDAVIVILVILLAAAEQGCPVSRLLADLPPRFTSSGRLKAFPTEVSRIRIDELKSGANAVNALFGDQFGKLKTMDQTDGLRLTFESDEVVHLRPSGNAPELRCYNEADSQRRADEMNSICLGLLERWR